MAEQLPLIPEDRPRRRRRWVPRCEDCNRRLRSPMSLRRRFGLLLGWGCYRRRVRESKRLRIPTSIPVRPPGDIPGQTELPLSDQDQEEM